MKKKIILGVTLGGIVGALGLGLGLGLTQDTKKNETNKISILYNRISKAFDNAKNRSNIANVSATFKFNTNEITIKTLKDGEKIQSSTGQLLLLYKYKITIDFDKYVKRIFVDTNIVVENGLKIFEKEYNYEIADPKTLKQHIEHYLDNKQNSKNKTGLRSDFNFALKTALTSKKDVMTLFDKGLTTLTELIAYLIAQGFKAADLAGLIVSDKAEKVLKIDKTTGINLNTSELSFKIQFKLGASTSKTKLIKYMFNYKETTIVDRENWISTNAGILKPVIEYQINDVVAIWTIKQVEDYNKAINTTKTNQTWFLEGWKKYIETKHDKTLKVVKNITTTGSAPVYHKPIFSDLSGTSLDVITNGTFPTLGLILNKDKDNKIINTQMLNTLYKSESHYKIIQALVTFKFNSDEIKIQLISTKIEHKYKIIIDFKKYLRRILNNPSLVIDSKLHTFEKEYIYPVSQVTALHVYNNAIKVGVNTNQITYNAADKTITVLNNAFKNSGWTNSTIPNHIKDLLPFVKYVGIDAFKNSQFTSLNLPKVEYIDVRAFRNSPLISLKMPKVITIKKDSFTDSKLTDLDLPNLETIDEWAFASSPIISLKLPKIKHIGLRVFQKAKVTTLNLPLIETVGEYAFYGVKITSLKMPNVLSIGKQAFVDAQLTTLNLPKVTIIGAQAFQISKITSLSLPNVITIKSNAFVDAQLTTLNLPKVTSIESYGFYRSVLKTWNLPNITSIGVKAFNSTPTGPTLQRKIKT